MDLIIKHVLAGDTVPFQINSGANHFICLIIMYKEVSILEAITGITGTGIRFIRSSSNSGSLDWNASSQLDLIIPSQQLLEPKSHLHACNRSTLLKPKIKPKVRNSSWLLVASTWSLNKSPFFFILCWLHWSWRQSILLLNIQAITRDKSDYMMVL